MHHKAIKAKEIVSALVECGEWTRVTDFNNCDEWGKEKKRSMLWSNMVNLLSTETRCDQLLSHHKATKAKETVSAQFECGIWTHANDR